MLKKLGIGGASQKLSALDTLRANVMLADAGLNITYMNRSLIALMREAEPELRRELPRFSMTTLIGSNIDIFHKVPSHQRNMLAQLEREHNATIRVGSRMFDLIVNPIKRGSKRVGFVVEWSDAKERLTNLDYAAQNKAFDRSNAMISFTPEGVILRANENFLKVMGYTLGEITGKHHSIFMEPGAAAMPEYAAFWKRLAQGEFQSGDFKRVAKNGHVIWVQGSYNPVLDSAGKVIRVEKFVADVTRRVTSVEEVGAALSRLADGDLEARVTNTLSKELDQLRLDYNRAADRLQASLQGVGHSAAEIALGTEEIRSAADDLSMRTERQAANLEETAAALDVITSAVKATSENSARARKIVEGAKADAEASATVVGKAVEAMQGIETSSRQIGQIIGVIDEIAFQTNLLALNAGVEAARAGDAGRGFAVVASEVRALAQRSAEAAKEIKALISASAGQVEAGVGLVAQTGEVLTKIVAQVSEINGTVATIAASAQEQANGLQGVNQAVNEMDRVTQQNAAMVQETTAAARSLSEEMGRLSEQVAQFKLGARNAAPQGGPPKRPAVRRLEKV